MQGRGDLAEYAVAIRSFSRNARLFIVHVIGMDTVHGTSLVLVNLYFLAVGLSIEFIGLRLLLGGIAGAICSVPAGLISDRIGRKWSFIIGDGVGAALYLITIFSVDQGLLLATGVLAAMFGTLHGVSEPAFMAENSEARERVHLFSVSDGLRTLSAMVGGLLGGFVPLLAASLADKVTLYRASIFIGIAIWALSLIPALMLRGHDRPSERAPSGIRHLFAAVRHPDRVLRLVAVGGMIALGFGFVGPLFNVFFSEGLHAHTHDIGVTFASGSLFLALAALAAPFLAARMTQVQAIVGTRLLAVPFILLIGLSPSLATVTTVLTLAGVAYVVRIVLANAAGPIAEAFSMEILDPGERGTMVGLRSTAQQTLSGLGAFAGARFMAAGDYVTPFVAMAVLYGASSVLFWIWFRPLERTAAASAGIVAAPEPAA
ncbi:MAG: MFS transporter [Chloroflexota bacterium]